MGLGDAQFVNAEAVSPSLRCCICQEIFLDPMFSVGKPCQHTFCETCIQEWLLSHKDCPNCRSAMEFCDLRPHEAIRDLIDELMVRCQEGCGWLGRLDASSQHLKSCPAAECKLLRQQVSSLLADNQRLAAALEEEQQLRAAESKDTQELQHQLLLVQERLKVSADASKVALVFQGRSFTIALPTPKDLPILRLPVGILFPGFGSHYVKMISEVKDIPSVRDMLTKANTVLGYDILNLCTNGPLETLSEPRCCSPALFIAGLAGLEKLRQENAEHAVCFQAVAGLDIGEYTALCAAGVFTFEDGLKIAQLYGQETQRAAANRKQALLSVAGIDKPKLQKLCKQAASKEGTNAVCKINVELFPMGFMCAGTREATGHLANLAVAAGALQVKASTCEVAFNTSLMEPAKCVVRQALLEMLPRMSSPKHIVFMNATAQPLKPGSDPKEVVELLCKQITYPVLWTPTVQAMIKDGIKEFYECGPNSQIKKVMKRISPEAFAATRSVEV